MVQPNTPATVLLPDEMADLTRDAIVALAAQPRRIERLDVPEWGGAVFVQALTAWEYEQYERGVRELQRGDGQAGSQRAMLVAQCAVDASGQPLFAPGKIDVQRIAELPVAGVHRVFAKALELCLGRESDADAAKKNSSTTTRDAS